MSSRRRIGLVLGFYLAVMAILAAAFFLVRQPPATVGPLPSEIPTVNPSGLPTDSPPSLAPLGSPQEIVERSPAPVSGSCSVTIPATVTRVDGEDNYRGLGPGDVICLAAGRRPNLKISNLHGGAANPIVIRNDGGVVRIVGTGKRLGGIGLVRSSSVRVTGTGVSDRCGAGVASDKQQCGIVIAGAFNGVRVAEDGSPRRIEIDHVRIERTSRQNHSTGISIHPEPGQTITGFYVHHNYLLDIYREGMYIGSEPHEATFQDFGKLADVDISHNLVQRTGYDGIKVKVAVRDVNVHDNVVISPGLAKFARHDGGILVAASTADVYNNVVRGGTEGIASGRPMPDGITRFFNNVVIGQSLLAFRTAEVGAMVYSNTILETGAGGIRVKGEDSHVFDNIIAGTSGAPIFGGSGLMATNNLVGPITHMGFVGPARGDVRLRSDSPAIDKGAVTGLYPPFDVLRTVRPQGARPDIGAYEYLP